jgi:hypothetical protein
MNGKIIKDEQFMASYEDTRKRMVFVKQNIKNYERYLRKHKMPLYDKGTADPFITVVIMFYQFTAPRKQN